MPYVATHFQPAACADVRWFSPAARASCFEAMGFFPGKREDLRYKTGNVWSQILDVKISVGNPHIHDECEPLMGCGFSF